MKNKEEILKDIKEYLLYKDMCYHDDKIKCENSANYSFIKYSRITGKIDAIKEIIDFIHDYKIEGTGKRHISK